MTGRIRTIKPSFFVHEELFDAEKETGLPLRVAFAGLFTQCDKEGRFEWRPRRLKTDILPYDDVDFSRVLHALATRGWVVKYACGDSQFGAIPTWHEHQHVNNRERDSELPPPPEPIEPASELTRAPRVDDACSTVQGNSEAERERERERDSEPIGSADAPLKERIFGALCDWLMEKTGRKRSSVASFLGRCIKEGGEAETLKAGLAAQKASAPDPLAYMRGALKCANGQDFSMTEVWKEIEDEQRSGQRDHHEADDDPVRQAAAD